MVNGIKKLSHVALESITRNCIVSAFFPKHIFSGQHALMRALTDATRKRIGNESLLKNRIKDAEHRVVQNPVSYRGFVNVANLRITNIEACIRPMSIFPSDQIPVKRKEILLKTELKFLNIDLFTLITSKFLPRQNEVL